MSRGFVVGKSIKFLKLVNKIYGKISINQNACGVKITYKAVDDKYCKIMSTRIYNDLDVRDVIFIYKNEKSIIIYIILKEN